MKPEDRRVGIKKIIWYILFSYDCTTEFIEWFYMFRDAFSGKKSLKNRWLYLIKPPGWKHDGTGKISSDLRKEWLKSNKNI